MIGKQITIDQCAAFSGLSPDEIFLGMTPTAKHDYLYARYLIHHAGDGGALRDTMVADIRAAVDSGEANEAADLLIVLRRFLSEHLGILVLVPSDDGGGPPTLDANPVLVHNLIDRKHAV